VRFWKRRLGFWAGNKPWIHGFSLLPAGFHFPFIGQCVRQVAGFETVIAYDNLSVWIAYYARRKYRPHFIYFNEGLPLPGGTQSVFSRIRDGVSKKLYTGADLVAAESEVVAAALRNEYGVPVVTTGCLINSDRFNLSTSGNVVREKYGLGNSPVVLFVDAVNPIKRVDMLMEACTEVRKALPETRLIVLGRYVDESLRQDILGKSDPSVIHVGYVAHDELPAFYAAATVFATCASWEEGCSHTILEAQACGKPVVAFDIPPHQEVIADGKTGILVDRSGDTRAFAEALLKILTNGSLGKEMGAAAAKRAVEMTTAGANGVLKLIEG
jgi:glycosyltransferase involved in cell wall biosynthesis